MPIFHQPPPTSSPSTKLLVFTDLDATLLDHQTYSYRDALGAIAQLKSHHCPIIFNSSKTRAEQAVLRQALDISDPFITENGSAVIIPSGQLNHAESVDEPEVAEPEVKVFGLPYEQLVAQVRSLRQQKGYRFKGFSDLSAVDLATITGLSEQQAAAAKQRAASEPLRWDDSEQAYQAFAADIAAVGLHTTQGGRFCHVMANTNKGTALTWLANRYRMRFPKNKWIVVALGDSPNDVPMLQAADIGVLIANPHRVPFEVSDVPNLIRSSQPGPAGWAEAIAAIIQSSLG